MRKYLSIFCACLLLAGCSSVPLTGRKQLLLVSEGALVEPHAIQRLYEDGEENILWLRGFDGDARREEDCRRHGTIPARQWDGGRDKELRLGI